MFNGRRQPSCDGTSRMTRECHVRICERLAVKFPGRLGKSAVLATARALPVCTANQTYSVSTATSQKGHSTKSLRSSPLRGSKSRGAGAG
jgi:hypothetical protein